MSLPTVTIFGTINKIETRFAANGTQITSFQIECSEKEKDGTYSNLYIKSAVFNKAAEFVNNYFQDGSVCIATGKLVTEVYEKEGVKKYEIKLKFPTIEFPPKAKGDNVQKQAPQYQQQHTDYQPRQEAKREMPTGTLPIIDIDDSEIPFNRG